MAVWLYSGPFTRFFLDDWKSETEIEQDQDDSAEDDEGEYEDEDSDDETDEGDEDADEATPAEVQKYFETFRNALQTELRPHLTGDLTWSEDLTAPRHAVPVRVTEFSALMLIASRAAIRDKRVSPISLLRDWYDDPAVQLIQDAEEDFAPIHHLVKADTWLPGDFPFVTATEVPERDVILGSLTQLTAALTEAGRILHTPNETTRKLSPKIVEDARRAHAAFEQVLAHATKHGAPILIDT